LHLSSIRLKGFKSFPDRVQLDFTPGVSVIVGPNGSGKSNITEAVLWALGEQSPLAVRGQKMADVIFAGGPGLPARRAAEVEVVVDNSDGELDSEFSELSIARRLDRSGEGEYRLNGARCRLIDVIEALSDSGLGKEMHSIVSQGRVEAIIHSKPRERRMLIEEAAGLSKHRKRRRRTQLKLGRTQENLARALDVEREARSYLRPLKRQAEAAELHARLERQSNEARLALTLDSARALSAELAGAEAEAAGARAEREQADQELQAIAARRDAAEQALASRGRDHEQRSSALFAARSALESVELRREAAAETARAAAQDAARCDQELRALERAAGEAQGDADDAAEADQAPPAPGAERLIDHVEVEPEFERAAERLLADVWVVDSLDEVRADFPGLVVTRDGLASSGIGGGLGESAAGEERSRAERLLHELAERERRERAQRLERLRTASARQLALAESADSVASALASAGAAVAERHAALEAELGDHQRAGEETTAELRACAHAEAEIQARLRAASESVTTTEVAAQKLRDGEAELAVETATLAARLELDEPQPSSEALTEDEREELERKVERLARRREQLGPVNPLAKAEYEEAVVRVDELEAARQDLESAMSELQGIIADTDRRIRERFEETFATAARNFEEVVEHLFPGGRGRLRLVRADGPRPVIGGEAPEGRAGEEPAGDGDEDDGDEDGLDRELGVEVELTPGGKSMRRLSLLSGGEKSLVALAFMFAVFLARPCPFYILDEVEAALDDLNIDRFLALLHRFSDRAQFIVVTHQKRTMDAADTLYGVSMGSDGVTKVVSRRLAAKDSGLAVAGEESAA